MNSTGDKLRYIHMYKRKYNVKRIFVTTDVQVQVPYVTLIDVDRWVGKELKVGRANLFGARLQLPRVSFLAPSNLLPQRVA